jgi:uncharacterized DUF497 family protein
MTDLPRIDHLVWDDWNQSHITKHAVLPEETEEVIAGESIVRETHKQRLQFIGPTLTGRTLSIVVGPVPGQRGVWYVFSARPASRKERAALLLARGGLSS